jgi:hypothetical protein
MGLKQRRRLVQARRRPRHGHFLWQPQWCRLFEHRTSDLSSLSTCSERIRPPPVPRQGQAVVHPRPRHRPPLHRDRPAQRARVHRPAPARERTQRARGEKRGNRRGQDRRGGREGEKGEGKEERVVCELGGGEEDERR